MVPHPFTGYPYLVTRIGHSPLRNMSVLPADWSRERLLDLARRQAIANQLETCLCLGPTESVFVSPDGTFEVANGIPVGLPVVDRLPLGEPIPETDELRARRERLEAFAECLKGTGYLVGDGLEGGRPATADDIRQLSGRDALGVPAGLSRCATCGSFAGDFLATKGEGNGDVRPRVVRVHCKCENYNHCARCGEPLAKSRLSAYEFSETDGKVWYAAAYIGLSHRCAL
jgi:ribosomal protein L32